MKKQIFLPFLLMLLVLQSCGITEEDYKPGINGTYLEIVVISENGQWESAIGAEIKNALEQIQFGLPQGEPIFTLIHLPEANLNASFKKFPSFLVINSPMAEGAKPGLEIKKDVWAKGQRVLNINAKDDVECAKILKENASRIKNFFKEWELGRQIAHYRKKTYDAAKGLKVSQKLDLAIPNGFKVVKEENETVWLRYIWTRTGGGYRHRINQELLLYSFEYTDANAFDDDVILKRIDSLMAANIPGPKPNSHMALEIENYQPKTKEISLNNKYAKETRGLWKGVGFFRGGPFITITTLDEANNRVLMLTGFVYAPNFKKRNFLFEMEAILKSLRL